MGFSKRSHIGEKLVERPIGRGLHVWGWKVCSDSWFGSWGATQLAQR